MFHETLFGFKFGTIILNLTKTHINLGAGDTKCTGHSDQHLCPSKVKFSTIRKFLDAVGVKMAIVPTTAAEIPPLAA